MCALLLGLLLAGCARANRHVTRYASGQVSSGVGVAVSIVEGPGYDAIDGREAELVACIQDTHEDIHPEVEIVPPKQFRAAAFPHRDPMQPLATDVDFEGLVRSFDLQFPMDHASASRFS